ncbi:MAG TPA: tetratricopeptide repeat protein [Terriglobales bacterium]|nr:tetratricopeptide repeat protein [Terriglobales bacterium]
MRSALTFLLLAAFLLPAFPACPAQTINPQTGAICEPPPPEMNAVRSKAGAGDAAAEYELGRTMLSARPTDSEFESAMPWFRRSAEQGYAPAEYVYGGVFREGRWKNPQQLVYWWTKAAEQGHADAQLWLGAFYEQGRDGVERNYPQAFKWLSRAAKQGQPDAQVSLGQMYEDGEAVPVNYRWAAYWYRKAADHVVDLGGAGQGANRLAQLYEHGHATSQDYIFVYLWYAFTQDAQGMNKVAKEMAPSQVADAQRRVRAWLNPRPPCP